MKYEDVVKGIFVKRENRFIAKVLMNDIEEIVHVKNTGRCKELLIPGVEVYLESATKLERKTKYSLITVKKGDRLINIDSQVPNKVVEDALKEGKLCLPGISGEITFLKREQTYGASRFDLYFETKEGKGFIEVKGVTLENQGVARFPDAPTQRGEKHVRELVKAREEGYLAYVVFLIQMGGVTKFEPNYDSDMKFAKALKQAVEKGVVVVAVDSYIGCDRIQIGDFIPVDLEEPRLGPRRN